MAPRPESSGSRSGTQADITHEANIFPHLRHFADMGGVVGQFDVGEQLFGQGLGKQLLQGAHNGKQ